jgi:hypothetical protein
MSERLGDVVELMTLGKVGHWADVSRSCDDVMDSLSDANIPL